MRLLIIGNLEGQVGAASRIAMERGAKVVQADDIETGLRTLRAGQGADLVLIDVKLDVAKMIESLNSERIAVPVVACGIGNDTRAAVHAIKAGAKEYLPLPPNADLIAAVLAAATEENFAIIHKDRRTIELLALADKIAASDASVLIVGASGTGKEMMARYVHAKSRRSEARFVAINCAAIPEALLESELFGHEKGAFTGAVARRIGRFEEANGGTLLLDEVSEMDPRLQVKLLRAVQEREIDRVGGSRPVKVDVRIIATSNRDLEQAIADKTFREDLYVRLNVVTLKVPPLCQRPEDIEVLAQHFADKYARANGFEPRQLATETRQKLLDYPWPGNVRELENAMHRAVLLASGHQIGPDAILINGAARCSTAATDCRSGSLAHGESHLVGRTVSDVERQLIIDTLSHCLGNRTHAANILGISIRTLRNKLRQYTDEGVAVPRPGECEQPAL
jgi:two-component system response regulator FlrC